LHSTVLNASSYDRADLRLLTHPDSHIKLVTVRPRNKVLESLRVVEGPSLGAVIRGSQHNLGGLADTFRSEFSSADLSVALVGLRVDVTKNILNHVAFVFLVRPLLEVRLAN